MRQNFVLFLMLAVSMLCMCVQQAKDIIERFPVSQLGTLLIAQ